MTTLDLRLLPIALALWAGAVIGLHTALHASLLVVLLIAAAASAVALQQRHGSVLWIVSLVIGASLAALRVDAASPTAVDAFIGASGRVDFEAVINAEPRVMDGTGFGGVEVTPTLRAMATVLKITSSQTTWDVSVPSTLQWTPGDTAFHVGEQVAGSALFRTDDAAARSTYRVAVRGPLRLVRPASRGTALATKVREGLALATHAQGGEGGATLLPGLVLGDTRAQSASLIDDLKLSGLSHLTAVSGANLAIVIAAVMWMLRRTSIRAHHRHLLVAVTILGFVAVVQPQPSVVRAAMMGGISVFALASGERRSSASVLWLTVALLLVIDPFLAWQYGFALSVAATAGLIVLRPLLLGVLPGGRVGDALLITLSAQVATLPILLMMGRPPTWLSVPANMLCEPLVAPATVLGFAAAVIAALALLPIPGASSVFLSVATAVATPGVWIADVIARIAHAGAASDLAVAPIGSIWALLLAGAVMFVLLRLGLRPRWLAMGVIIYLLLSTCTPQMLQRWPQADWWYAVCDVGQGDSSVFNLGAGAAIVIDMGPDAQRERTCLRQLGVRSITAVFITHFHADHVEGAAGLASRAAAQAVFSTPFHEPTIEWSRTVTALGRTPSDLRAGDRLVFGSTSVHVLWPVPEQLEGNPNNASLVLDVARGGTHVLVTGDVDAAAQAALRLPLRGFAVLKVPHHGSRFQDRTFFARVRPGLAVISVGAGNDYGHPALTTVDTLHAQGARVLRTDELGAIAFAVQGRQVSFRALSG